MVNDYKLFKPQRHISTLKQRHISTLKQRLISSLFHISMLFQRHISMLFQRHISTLFQRHIETLFRRHISTFICFSFQHRSSTLFQLVFACWVEGVFSRLDNIRVWITYYKSTTPKVKFLNVTNNFYLYCVQGILDIKSDLMSILWYEQPTLLSSYVFLIILQDLDTNTMHARFRWGWSDKRRRARRPGLYMEIGGSKSYFN